MSRWKSRTHNIGILRKIKNNRDLNSYIYYINRRRRNYKNTCILISIGLRRTNRNSSYDIALVEHELVNPINVGTRSHMCRYVKIGPVIHPSRITFIVVCFHRLYSSYVHPGFGVSTAKGDRFQ